MLVTDADLRPLGRHDLVRRGPSFANALVEGVAYGCATLLNRSAVELVRAPLPDHAVMHDAWCYLLVSALGQVVYDPTPTVRYRQHDRNTVGVGAGRLSRWWRRAGKAWSPDYVSAYVRQAAELPRLHAHRLPEPVRQELDALLDPGAAARVRYALVGGAHRQDRVGTLGVRTLHALGRTLPRTGAVQPAPSQEADPARTSAGPRRPTGSAVPASAGVSSPAAASPPAAAGPPGAAADERSTTSGQTALG